MVALVEWMAMIYTHILAAFIAALATWLYQENRYADDITKLRLEHVNAIKDAVIQVRADEQAINTRYQGAINAARLTETTLRSDADAARTERDRLRTQLAKAARRIPTAPASTCTEYATTVGELLDHCSRDYQELAGKADGHAADARTCTAAWPVN